MSLQIQWTRIALQSLSEVSDYKKELQVSDMNPES